jgi:hypothetical protein
MPQLCAVHYTVVSKVVSRKVIDGSIPMARGYSLDES